MAMVLYGFFCGNINLIINTLMTLVGVLIMGFAFNTYLLGRKHKVDEDVLHLSREILHELAIPLSTIQANTLLLKRTCHQNEKSLKRLGRIEDASRRLERLYTELIYSINKEIHIVERETFNLARLIEERIEVMHLFKRNEFIVKLEATNVLVDKIGFEKMLDNILNNAMKYSSKESPIVVTLKDAMLSIQDYGVGMDEWELINIYNRYYQSQNNNQGEGIGLALVRAYCIDEKIDINIKSKKGKGTEVILNLHQISLANEIDMIKRANHIKGKD